MGDPSWFVTDPRLAWAFWHFRYQAYALGTPHTGYDILAKWGRNLPYGLFSATSNIDGHWVRTQGVGPERLYECHGTVMRMQPLDGKGTWETDPKQYESLEVPVWDLVPGESVEVSSDGSADGTWTPAMVGADGHSIEVDGRATSVRGVRRPSGPDLMRVSAASPLPKCADGSAARPNVLMFGDWGVDVAVIDRQESAMQRWLGSLPSGVRLVVIEVGAGTAVSTIRRLSERMVNNYQRSALIRINLEDSNVPFASGKGLAVGGLGALDALTRMDALLTAHKIQPS